ncbi:MAG: hypothetical protein RLZZ630_1478 [Bacteroidota bacterium]
MPGAKLNDRPAYIKLVQDSFATTLDFDAVKARYDTLIPIMGGWFITCDSFNYAAYKKMIPEVLPEDSLNNNWPSILRHVADGLDGFTPEVKKWGVIDSTGRIIIPIMCDGVRELDNGQGVFSIYKGSLSLNTGLPRYNYSGYYFFFNSDGQIKNDGKLFSITTVFVGDFHQSEFVIENGHTFYLPAEYHIPNKKVRGAVSKVPYGK